MESTWEYDNKEGSSGKLIEHRTNRKTFISYILKKLNLFQVSPMISNKSYGNDKNVSFFHYGQRDLNIP